MEIIFFSFDDHVEAKSGDLSGQELSPGGCSNLAECPKSNHLTRTGRCTDTWDVYVPEIKSCLC